MITMKHSAGLRAPLQLGMHTTLLQIASQGCDVARPSLPAYSSKQGHLKGVSVFKQTAMHGLQNHICIQAAG